MSLKQNYPRSPRFRLIFGLLMIAGLAMACNFTTTGPAATLQPTLTVYTVNSQAAGNPAQTPTPQASLTPTNSGPKTYPNTRFGVTFVYPGNWQEISPGRLEGPDGFANLESRKNDGAGPESVCIEEANRNKPDTYGSTPEIRDLITSAGTPACLILPSADQPASRKGEAIYFLWYPKPERQDQFLAFHADKAHIETFIKTLRLPQVPTPVAAACDFSVQSQSPSTIQESGLRIDEYPVAQGADCSPAKEGLAFNDFTSSGSPAARANQVIAAQWGWDRISRLNARLASFGFRVVAGNKTYSILRYGYYVKTRLNWLGELTVDPGGTDFILPVLDSYNSQIYLIRSDGVHALENWDILTYDRVFPVFATNGLVTPAYDYDTIKRQIGTPALITLKQNDQRIATYSIAGSTASGGPVRGLWSWDGHWVMEMPGVVVQDGQILNDQLGVSEMFTWKLLRDQPFYFSRKDGQIHPNYAGQDISVAYDEVIHDPQGPTTEMLQMQSFESGLLFYARRGDTWYYVTLQAVK